MIRRSTSSVSLRKPAKRRDWTSAPLRGVAFGTWTRWQHIDETRRGQIRWCLGCGKEQKRNLNVECQHVWRTDQHGNVVEHEGAIPVGRFYDQICKGCGLPRRKTVYTSAQVR